MRRRAGNPRPGDRQRAADVARRRGRRLHGEDRIRPSIAINKEIDLRFVLGYTPREFHETLHLLADGTLQPAALLTGTVALAEVPQAFEALRDPEAHAKILIDPRATSSTL
jgi:threonine dehydrogenase-like Zn-dependent dehydrogenase